MLRGKRSEMKIIQEFMYFLMLHLALENFTRKIIKKKGRREKNENKK